MQALILAAGMGLRLGTLTKENTKCMLKINGKTLIEHMLDVISKTKTRRVGIVVGYKGENLKKFVGSEYKGLEIVYIENPVYYKTNNIYSLYLANDFLTQDDTLLLESDLIFEESVIFKLLDDPRPNLVVVSKYHLYMEGSAVVVDDQGAVSKFITKADVRLDELEKYYKTVNIYKLSKEFSTEMFAPLLKVYCSAVGRNEYYEEALKVIASIKTKSINALILPEDEKWREVDDIEDLNNAKMIFAPDRERLSLYQKKFGGYWRFPGLKDFCYLVNPYFPPQAMLDKMKLAFEDLISSYPSGLDSQNLLVSKMYHWDIDKILVANGASELINIIVDHLPGPLGVIFPTFDEYAARAGRDRVKKFIPANKDFSYTAEDLKEFAEREDISALVLINPDNPSGHYLPGKDVLSLIERLSALKIKLILDESFIDFAENGPEDSLLKSDVLEKYKETLIIIKSVSKSYGVPGLRLGVAASGDENLLRRVREKMPIWNINSFAEFFLQIFGSYKSDYFKAREKIIEERKRFYKKLKEISFLRTLPSQANYFLCEVSGKDTAAELAEKLLLRHKIFIKECGGKTGFENKEYVRIAIRNSQDNDYLIEKLREL